jgi:hypothetical protein
MKKIKFAFLLFFSCSIILSLETFAQAEVVFGNEVAFYDYDKEPHISISSKTTLTPSGNIVKTADFQLPEGHELIPEKGKNFVAAKITSVDIEGNVVVMYDVNIGIDKTGKFSITYHSNGAGTISPAKYKRYFD